MALIKVQIDNPNATNHRYALDRSVKSAIRLKVNQPIIPVATSPIMRKPRDDKFKWLISSPFSPVTLALGLSEGLGITADARSYAWPSVDDEQCGANFSSRTVGGSVISNLVTHPRL